MQIIIVATDDTIPEKNLDEKIEFEPTGSMK